MKNLYTFSKNSWHVRFFKWLFKEDPTKMYKTMCPYFWTYVVVILFLPIILIIKAFGKAGTALLNKLRTYKRDKEDRLIKELNERLRSAITPEAAYKVMKSKCFRTFGWCGLTWEERQKVEELYYQHRHLLRQKEEEKEEARDKRRTERYVVIEARREKFTKTKTDFTESKIVNVLGYIILYAAIGILLYGAVRLVMYLCTLHYPAPNWNLIGIVTLIILGAAAFLFIVYAFFRYLVFPFFSWLGCQLGKIDWSFMSKVGKVLSYLSYLKYLGIPFWLLYKAILAVGRLFAIIGSMIYATYKKHCPIITWKE